MKALKFIAVLAAVAGLSSCSLRGADVLDEDAAENMAAPGTVPFEEATADMVKFGSIVFDMNETALTLESGSYRYKELLEKLGQLPMLQTLTLPCTNLTADELDELRAAYPHVELQYTVELFGKEIPHTATELDLSGIVPENVDEAVQKMRKLPQLQYVELMNGGECALTMSDVKLLNNGVPNAVFHYTFELFGKTISTTDDTVEYANVQIGNEGEEAIRAALDIMQDDACFTFDDCGIDSEIMALIRNDYPNMSIVWRVHCGYFNLLTDEETVCARFDLNDGNCDELKYCTEVKYMDISSNAALTNISFIEDMPKLEILILSGNPVEDLTPLAVCTSLEWLELVWCGCVADISPLEGCTNLKYVNVSYTEVTDLSSLADKPLERFVYCLPNISAQQEEEFLRWHPECQVRFLGEEPYMLGWRYDDTAGAQPFEMYSKICEIFRYNENFYNHKDA